MNFKVKMNTFLLDSTLVSFQQVNLLSEYPIYSILSLFTKPQYAVI